MIHGDRHPIRSLRYFTPARLIILLLVFISTACNSSNQTVKINLCQDGTIAPLLLLAQEKGYFGDEGIEITYHPMGDGRLAMDSFLEGKCTVAVISEPTIAARIPGRQDFSIIATIGSTDNGSRIISDRRKGMTGGSDLKGRRIGVRKGEISHYFLDMYLRKNALRPEQASIRFMEPQYLSEALLRGQIDAFASSDIYLTEAARRLGENAAVLSEPGLCLNHSFLLLRKSTLKERPAVAEALVKALLKAQTRAESDPDELAGFVAKRRELSAQAAKELVSHHRLRVELKQQMLPGLDDYTAFMQEQGQAQSSKGYGFMALTDDSPLRKVRPAAINIR